MHVAQTIVEQDKLLRKDIVLAASCISEPFGGVNPEEAALDRS